MDPGIETFSQHVGKKRRVSAGMDNLFKSFALSFFIIVGAMLTDFIEAGPDIGVFITPQTIGGISLLLLGNSWLYARRLKSAVDSPED